ncbi:polysaccharide biosynthesis tyrosine autokinase [Raineyella sp.]|uniref:polysaccharide biosynthesis tyrosine autokinase n=1 Tax=Raineyella sp. TaxID=1911550 RepID=UPI002B20D54E|nr:polysaccharide biosynthesis tyrosine autokinase [Raineyella sp.]MEA5153332.1 polysaccharide biosynthesis tyrosine autokinase [Raineyella sp.]
MELRDYLTVLRKYWRSITAVTIFGVLGAAILSFFLTPVYTSKTALFFSVNGASSASDLAQGTSFTQKQVESYVQVATSPLVLQPVIARIPLATTPAALAEHVKVTVPTNTSVIDIAVDDPNPATATAIADAIGAQLVTAVHDLSPEGGQGQRSVAATVITPATVPSSPTSPKIPQNLALGLLLGLFVGVGQAILRKTLDTRVRTAADVARVTDAPIIGRIAYDKAAAGRSRFTPEGQDPVGAEAFRRLRTNLQYLDAGQGRRSFVITSSVADEGKTSTAVNTAATLSAAGLRVLLVDADLRKPSLGRLLGLEDAAGLSTVLIGHAQLGDVLQAGGLPGLHVVTSGPVPPNPSELLGSVAMSRLVETITQQYDAVVIDAPPLLPVTDAAILSRLTSGALVVVGSGEVRSPQLTTALESLESVDGRVLGVVLNKVRGESAGYGSYYGRAEPASETRRKVARRAVAEDWADRPREIV